MAQVAVLRSGLLRGLRPLPAARLGAAIRTCSQRVAVPSGAYVHRSLLVPSTAVFLWSCFSSTADSAPVACDSATEEPSKRRLEQDYELFRDEVNSVIESSSCQSGAKPAAAAGSTVQQVASPATQVLGEGTFGVVFKGRCRRTGKEVAIKVRATGSRHLPLDASHLTSLMLPSAAARILPACRC